MKILECSTCGEHFAEANLKFFDGQYFCQVCYEELIAECYTCNEKEYKENMEKCETCGEWFCEDHVQSHDYFDGKYCECCYDELKYSNDYYNDNKLTLKDVI